MKDFVQGIGLIALVILVITTEKHALMVGSGWILSLVSVLVLLRVLDSALRLRRRIPLSRGCAVGALGLAVLVAIQPTLLAESWWVVSGWGLAAWCVYVMRQHEEGFHRR